MQLNKYIAHAGVCSRRSAAQLIKMGQITINHAIEKNPGYRVQEKDVVRYKKQVVTPQEPLYIILNKPAECVSTTSDDKSRTTVIDLVQGAINQRAYPIGRLDYSTTGLLLLTNDGELSQKLAHPRFNIQKTYRVTVDRELEPKDIDHIREGVRLSDGRVKVDRVVLEHKTTALVTLHSGKKHVIKRIFGAFGYHVHGLDRIAFGNLTTYGLQRGSWRYLTKREISFLTKENN
jgi:23S rRNA pseudouridine2605 synthase